MLFTKYEYKLNRFWADGAGFDPVHGGHCGRRKQHQAAGAETIRRQQLGHAFCELARSDGVYRSGFNLHGLIAPPLRRIRTESSDLSFFPFNAAKAPHHPSKTYQTPWFLSLARWLGNRICQPTWPRQNPPTASSSARRRIAIARRLEPLVSAVNFMTQVEIRISSEK